MLIYDDKIVIIVSIVKIIQGNMIIKEDFNDLEDGLQETCAFCNKIDYIITRNVKDSQKSRIKVLSPSEFVSII